jgi:hypothetical protein
MQGRTVRVSVAEPRKSSSLELRISQKRSRSRWLNGGDDLLAIALALQPRRVDSEVVSAVEPRWPNLPTNGDDPGLSLLDRLRPAVPLLRVPTLPTDSTATRPVLPLRLSTGTGVRLEAASSPRPLMLLRLPDENPGSAGLASEAVGVLRGQKEVSTGLRVGTSGIG